ncbi:MAG TPA: hypothetical protein VIK26_11380, partial [Clostridium sp.]
DAGKYMPIEQSVDVLFKDINIPMYSKVYIQNNKESVGGMITYGDDLGKEVGKLALRIVDGEKISDIPVTEDSSHKYVFNYDKLKQFNIDMEALPRGSEIINKPNKYYNMSEKQILYIVSTVIFIIIGAMIFVIIDKKSTGVDTKNIIDGFAPLYNDKVKFVFSDEDNITKLKEKVNSLPKDTIIYFFFKFCNILFIRK